MTVVRRFAVLGLAAVALLGCGSDSDSESSATEDTSRDTAPVSTTIPAPPDGTGPCGCRELVGDRFTAPVGVRGRGQRRGVLNPVDLCGIRCRAFPLARGSDDFSAPTGEDYFLWVGDTDAVLDEVEEFFTGTRPTRTPTRALATVVFTDIVGSTRQAVDLGDEAWRARLARHDDLTRQHVEDHDGRVVKSTGDGALATFDDPEDAIAAAQDLIADLADAGLDIRVGIHSGQIEITGDDVAGIAVHLAARISALARPGDIYVSRTVRDFMLGSTTQFDDRGTHDLKGIPEQWQIFAVVGD
jgi:class 3 adenylate cyclase